MRVMVLVKASENSEAGVLPDTGQLTDMNAFNEELVKAGVLLSGEGLHPSSRGVRVRLNDNHRTVINGPFNEIGTLVAGFWIWRVGSMDEAIAWAKRCPDSIGESAEIELRPVMEAEDFGEAFTPELREQEERLRSATGAEVAG